MMGHSTYSQYFGPCFLARRPWTLASFKSYISSHGVDRNTESIFLAKFWGWYLITFFVLLSFNPKRIKQIINSIRDERDVVDLRINTIRDVVDLGIDTIRDVVDFCVITIRFINDFRIIT